jgi:hypothetical protein
VVDVGASVVAVGASVVDVGAVVVGAGAAVVGGAAVVVVAPGSGTVKAWRPVMSSMPVVQGRLQSTIV